MPLVNFSNEGNRIDYTPSSAVASGAVVVQGELVGIATAPIAANALGSLAVVGVFEMPKATGSGTGIGAGAVVYWDATNQVVTTSAGAGANKLLGKAVAAAATTSAVVLVRLSQ